MMFLSGFNNYRPFFRAIGAVIMLHAFTVLLDGCTSVDDRESRAEETICIEDFDSFKETGYQKTSFAAMMQQQTLNEQCGWLCMR
ncbi:MAG: hypothetical protein JW913_00810 [Chitinispirillaceae bacterium]|nr:hypothetical protein [Chitinispirillaceae bacterium]